MKRKIKAPKTIKASASDIASVLRVLERNTHRFVQRAEIAAITHIHERLVRAAVQAIVDEGIAAVVPDRRGGGYVITSDPIAIGVEMKRLQSQIRLTKTRVTALGHLKRIAANKSSNEATV